MPIPYFDAHCDTITSAMRGGQGLRVNDLHLDLERLSRHAPSGQVFAVFTRPKGWRFNTDYAKEDCSYEDLAPVFEHTFRTLLEELEANADLVTLCRSAADCRAATGAGKVAALIAVEGAELIGCSLEKLREVYDAGVRLVNLTWNYQNAVCGSNQSGGGLTAQGREFVLAAQRMGVAVDLSHCSDAAFFDCMEIAEKPLLAGHSNARALCGHPRNLTDEMFSALAKNGGVAGLNLYPLFLGENADGELAAAHIEHFLALGGEKALCLGTDFDGIESTPRDIPGVQAMDVLYETLLRHGHSEALVRDIFYNNFVDYLDRAIS